MRVVVCQLVQRLLTAPTKYGELSKDDNFSLCLAIRQH